jgi:hypothetical protein
LTTGAALEPGRLQQIRHRLKTLEGFGKNLKGISNNTRTGTQNDITRHLCVEDLRNGWLLLAIFALIWRILSRTSIIQNH